MSMIGDVMGSTMNIQDELDGAKFENLDDVRAALSLIKLLAATADTLIEDEKYVVAAMLASKVAGVLAIEFDRIIKESAGTLGIDAGLLPD